MDSQSTIGAKIRVELEAGNIEQTIDQINQAIDRISPGGEGAISDMMDMTGRGRGGMQGQMNRAAEVQRLYDSAMGAFSSDKMMSNGKFEEYNYQYQQWSALADKTSPESQKLKQKMSDALRSIYNDQMAEAKKIIEAGEKTLPSFGFSAEDSTEIGKIIRGDVRDKYVSSRRVAESIGEKPEAEQEPQVSGGMGRRMAGFIASSAAGVAGTLMTNYAHDQTAWGATAIEQYNARQSFEIQQTQTMATMIGSVIGGLLGAIGGSIIPGAGTAVGMGLGSIMGAGAGGILGSGIASILNIGDVNEQKLINAYDPLLMRTYNQFNSFDIQKTRAAMRLTGKKEGLDQDEVDTAYYEALGISQPELIQLKSGFSAGYGYNEKRFDAHLSYAKANGIDIKELGGLSTLLRFGGNAGTNELGEMMMGIGGKKMNALTGEMVNYMVSQTQQAALQGFRGNDITSERQGVLDHLYGSDTLRNPLGLAGQSIQGFQSLTSNMGSPASFALLAGAYGLGTETDYAGFLKRVNQGFTKENVQDVGRSLFNTTGGNEGEIYKALHGLVPGQQNESWRLQTAKAMAEKRFEDLTERKLAPGNKNVSPSDALAGVAEGEKTNAESINIEISTGAKNAGIMRDRILLEAKNTNVILDNTNGAIDLYFEIIKKQFVDIQEKIRSITDEMSRDVDSAVKAGEKTMSNHKR